MQSAGGRGDTRLGGSRGFVGKVMFELSHSGPAGRYFSRQRCGRKGILQGGTWCAGAERCERSACLGAGVMQGHGVCRREWPEVGLEVLAEVIVGRLWAAARELWDLTLQSGVALRAGGGTAWLCGSP